MANFFRKDEGLLVVPDNIRKNLVSWTLDNVISGFKKFYEENGRWPVHEDMRTCLYLPNVKTLQRKFGGIKNVRNLMGLNITDFSRGTERSKKSVTIGKRGFRAEEKLYAELVKLFHEPFVHAQARVINNDLNLSVDFVVFHQGGKFAVDIFYSDSAYTRFSNNLSVKYKTYTNFPYELYLVAANQDITQHEIDKFLKSTKRVNMNSKLSSVTYGGFIKYIARYRALADPYVIK